jgi:methionine sulfoxide reductase heme-binding subunit
MVQAINSALRRVPPLALYLAGLVPLLWLVWLLVSGALGVDPVKRIEHQLGEWALQLLLAGLAITPLRRFAGVNLIRYRRAIGLLAFLYVTLHLTTWLLLDIQLRWSEIWADIVKRPYITAGFASFVAMLPLAITSNNRSVRRMGARAWQNLHRLTYFAALAGAVHYIWLVKAWPPEPLVYLGLTVFLLIVRLIPKKTTAINPA